MSFKVIRNIHFKVLFLLFLTSHSVSSLRIKLVKNFFPKALDLNNNRNLIVDILFFIFSQSGTETFQWKKWRDCGISWKWFFPLKIVDNIHSWAYQDQDISHLKSWTIIWHYYFYKDDLSKRGDLRNVFFEYRRRCFPKIPLLKIGILTRDVNVNKMKLFMRKKSYFRKRIFMLSFIFISW